MRRLSPSYRGFLTPVLGRVGRTSRPCLFCCARVAESNLDKPEAQAKDTSNLPSLALQACILRANPRIRHSCFVNRISGWGTPFARRHPAERWRVCPPVVCAVGFRWRTTERSRKNCREIATHRPQRLLIFSRSGASMSNRTRRDSWQAVVLPINISPIVRLTAPCDHATERRLHGALGVTCRAIPVAPISGRARAHGC